MQLMSQESNVERQLSIKLTFCRSVPPDFLRSFLLWLEASLRGFLLDWTLEYGDSGQAIVFIPPVAVIFQLCHYLFNIIWGKTFSYLSGWKDVFCSTLRVRVSCNIVNSATKLLAYLQQDHKELDEKLNQQQDLNGWKWHQHCITIVLQLKLTASASVVEASQASASKAETCITHQKHITLKRHLYRSKKLHKLMESMEEETSASGWKKKPA